MADSHFDVLIVGAGLSGIGAAVHLQQKCPSKSYVILEGRDAMGGTWDLFRYPGIRSDSDMHTLGYEFKPWTDAKAIADGPSIKRYVRETADEHDITQHIRFGHKVTAASWSSEEARWQVTAEHGGQSVTFTCSFLYMCSGYYKYEAGYTPDFEGMADFSGEIVHPQLWTDDIDYADKKVVVIGSGATAVTLIPELAKDADHVVMLQRSPTYMVSRPARDGLANALRAVLPDRWAYSLTRWKNIRLSSWFYKRSQTKPEKVKQNLLKMLGKHLKPGYDIETHFTPSYGPWDQRLCLVPDADMFDALNSGKASIVTDHIERFEAKGIRLKSGELLEADLIVTATGLDLQVFGGLSLEVDGKALNSGELVNYKGIMFGGVPNFANTFGYTNASWTLKADITAEYVCRLLNHLDETGTQICVPEFPETGIEVEADPPLSSGYFARAVDRLPKQGSDMPWQQTHDYLNDRKVLRDHPLKDGYMKFVAIDATTPSSSSEKVLDPA
ncbi:MAG: NAD(P)/FAD-dependent oxidoreductase [Pseudomonadota bacterium]